MPQGEVDERRPPVAFAAGGWLPRSPEASKATDGDQDRVWTSGTWVVLPPCHTAPPGLPTVPVSAMDRRRDQPGGPGAARIDGGFGRTDRVRWNRTRSVRPGPPMFFRVCLLPFGQRSGARGLGCPRASDVIRYRGVVSGTGPLDCNRRGQGARLCRIVFPRCSSSPERRVFRPRAWHATPGRHAASRTTGGEGPDDVPPPPLRRERHVIPNNTHRTARQYRQQRHALVSIPTALENTELQLGRNANIGLTRGVSDCVSSFASEN